MTKPKLSVRDQNKQIKLKKITSAAYELFATKGIDNTTIDNIVKKAGIAKGTFYLYFEDKSHLVQDVVFKNSSILLERVISEAEKKRRKENLSFTDTVILVIDSIISELEENQVFLKIINKNLSWGLYEEMGRNPVISDAMEKFILNSSVTDVEVAKKRFYIIVELMNAVCYNAIIMNIPCKMNEIKEELLQLIRKIIEEE